MTPDPGGMAVADPANPQSWNRYAYVMNNPLNATDPFGLCYFGDGATIGVSGPRNPGLECGTGALDSSNSGGCMTDASCSGAPVGPSHEDPAGTADSFLNQSIAQNTAQAEAAYASWAYAMEKTGGEYVGANGVRVAIGWTMYGGVNGVNESNGEMVDAAGLAELIGSPSAAFMGGGGMGFSGTTYFGANPVAQPSTPSGNGNYNCSLFSSNNGIGVCSFTCHSPDGDSLDVARIPTYVIQKACSTTNRSCPVSLQVYPPSHWGPIDYGRPKVVPNSCVYGKVQ